MRRKAKLTTVVIALLGTLAGSQAAFASGTQSPQSPQDSFGVVGTPAADRVVIDEPAGELSLNNLLVARFDGALNNTFVVDTLEGDDEVLIFDGEGEDNYLIKTRVGNDVVKVWDRGGSDNYDLDTGVWVEDDYDVANRNDIVWIKDGANDRKLVQRYTIRTASGHDQVTIRDSSKGQSSNPKVSNYDIYDINTWCEDDMVTITDARFVDVYSILADGACDDNPFDYDTLTIEDRFQDPDNAGWDGFEKVDGRFI